MENNHPQNKPQSTRNECGSNCGLRAGPVYKPNPVRHKLSYRKRDQMLTNVDTSLISSQNQMSGFMLYDSIGLQWIGN